MKALQSFLHMPPADKAALAIAWILLAATAVLLRIVPFRRLVGKFGHASGAHTAPPPITDLQANHALLVRRAISRAARISPLRSDCLPQALVAATMCRLLGVPFAVHLGARLDEAQSFEAHAWTIAGDVAVTGGKSFTSHTIVASFRSLPTSRPGVSA